MHIVSVVSVVSVVTQSRNLTQKYSNSTSICRRRCQTPQYLHLFSNYCVTKNYSPLILSCTTNDLSLIPVRSAVKSYLTNLSKARSQTRCATWIMDNDSVMEFGLKQVTDMFELAPHVEIARTWSQTGSQLSFDQLLTDLRRRRIKTRTRRSASRTPGRRPGQRLRLDSVMILGL